LALASIKSAIQAGGMTSAHVQRVIPGLTR
jgi:hypothetical protein